MFCAEMYYSQIPEKCTKNTVYVTSWLVHFIALKKVQPAVCSRFTQLNFMESTLIRVDTLSNDNSDHSDSESKSDTSNSAVVYKHKCLFTDLLSSRPTRC